MRTRHAVLSGLATLAVVGAAVGSRADAAPEVPWGQRPVTVGSGFTLASTPSQDVFDPAPAVTASGRWVVFATRAALDPNDIDGEPDVYLRDRWTDLTRLLPGEGFILNLAVSAGGSYAVSSREVRDPELGPQVAHRFYNTSTGRTTEVVGPYAERFRSAGIRAVPGAIVRRGAHIGKNVVLMPSFVNIGANVGDGTMIDTWASVGSCAQVGQHCHISAGAGIGGVLEPMQANPTIIGDNCFIGARSEIVEGVIVGEGCVVAMGVFITATSKIVYRDTGKVITGHIPPFSVVVPGAMPGKPLPDGTPGPSLACAVIIKQVDAQTRAKTGINDLLRD